MDEPVNEETQAIIEESKKLLCRPWEEVQAEIRKRQTLGKLPQMAHVSPLPELNSRTIKPENLPNPKPHI